MSAAPRVAMTLTQDWHAVPGGTAVAANALARELIRRDGVELIAAVPRGGEPTEGFAPQVPTARLGLPVPVLYDAWNLLRRPLVTSATGAVDLVHLTVPIACPRESVPMVATVHDLFPLTMPRLFTRRGAGLMARGLRRIRDEAAAVMVPTEVMRAEFVDHGFDPDRLHVVPLGVDRVPDPDAVRSRELLAGLGIGEPFVLFVGTAEPRKGLDVLIDALRSVQRDLRLVVVGPEGWGDVEPSLATLGNRVVRTGFLPEADLRILQATATVTCVPSRAEGFGLPVLEAMAAGSPVVTTSSTSMEEVAGGAALLVPAGDATALGRAIDEVVGDPSAADELRRLGRLRAAAMTWARAAERVESVYRAVLG